MFKKKPKAGPPKIVGQLTEAQRQSVIMVVTGLLDRAELGAEVAHGDDGSVLIRIPKVA